MELLAFDFPGYLRGETEQSPERWFELAVNGWGISDPLLADFLDGLLTVPLAIAMGPGQLTAHECVRDWFLRHEWAVKVAGNVELTAAGRYLLDHVRNAGTVLSYAPMLLRLRELIFGSPRTVFAEDDDGRETHVERTLNVESCGLQHEKFFAGADEIIIEIFNCEPLERQPRYVVDMGCGDGSMLRRIFEVVRGRTARGRALEAYPLTMVGADYTEASLEAAARTLSAAGIPHFTLRGDIGEPARLMADLKARGVENPEQVLHVRSFLDHNRPYRAPTDRSREQQLLDGVFVDEDGACIDPADMQRSLVEHLRRWAQAVSSHGLLLLEVHCLPPWCVERYLDRSESLHFDAYHGFSRQYPVTADAFLLAASEAGLFPRREHFRRYPQFLPFTRITLNHFERRAHSIRKAVIGDMPALLRLEQVGWPSGLRQPEDTLRARVERGGAFVLEMDGKVVGAAHCQRIRSVDELRSCTHENADRLHDPTGPVVQLLGLYVLPEMRERELGDELLTFLLEISAVTTGVTTVVGVTRCSRFDAAGNGSYAEYVARRDERGLPVDPNPRFHAVHGATIGDLLPGYRAKDAANQGFGILVQYDVQYDLHSLRPAATQAPDLSSAREAVKAEFESAVRRILGQESGWIVPDDQPLMDMGLDSMALMELRALVEQRLGVKLGHTFFFKHPTLVAAVEHLARQPEIADRFQQASRAAAQPPIVKSDSAPSKKEGSPRNLLAPIAVVGMAYRFPGAEGDGLWQLLAEGRDAIGAPPAHRWEWPSGMTPESRFARGGYLADIESFDAEFFRIAPSKAELMDPQQRMLLELSWELLENAGYRARDLAGRAWGVFVGACHYDYRERLAGLCEEGDGHLPAGVFASMLANRISYFYNLTGPSLAVDTACSSSLVAVHHAVQALRIGECEVALAGGVNLICSPLNTLSFHKAGMLSPDCLPHLRCGSQWLRARGKAPPGRRCSSPSMRP